ncbi:hypothetical protein BKH42_01290 [Helicobacter sp. 13S00482-2]|uniref:NAD(P)H-dependent oxidoreductase n=1 Tax=Helicobacter sp. 13S00482-2 TaxID=1476200 RepID=UPI000BA78A5B|nr:NAD(P)H-dependent oxidoreductase [Helicobacter sp. 13S00482-2]PAF54568.1 hypothetical protein BKH42_01290 [Helicobacter sp. 13S00482-2]
MRKDEILDIIKRRYSCRDFDRDKKISLEDFEVILEAGRFAPSSLGLEPWKFVVITSDFLKNEIAKDALGNQTKIQDCSHLVVVNGLIGDMIRPDCHYVKSLYEGMDIYAVISEMILSVRENRLKGNEKAIDAYVAEQCFIAIGQMTQTAAMLDIDSCIIGGFYAKGLKKLLNEYIDMECLNPVCLISFGYSIGNRIPNKHRKPYEEAVKWLH